MSDLTSTDDQAKDMPDRPSGGRDVRAGAAIGLIAAAGFVMILNETTMSVALEPLIGELQVTATTVQWLTSGFLLTVAVVLPTSGYLLQRFAPHQVFVASMALFSFGTLLCALAPGFAALLAGRVVQASGTAVMMPLLTTTVMNLVPAERRGASMGTITVVIAVAPAIGPTISGFILGSLGWRWIFWMVLPLALAALVLGAARLRVPVATSPASLDVLSVLLSAVGFGGLVYSLSVVGGSVRDAGSEQWTPAVGAGLGAIALVAFVVRQRRLRQPLLDLRPLTQRTFAAATVTTSLLFMFLLGTASILVPMYLQAVLGADSGTAGWAVLPGGLVLGLLGRPVGRAFDRFGARPLVLPGAVALAASLWAFALLRPATVATVMILHVALMATLGLLMTPLRAEALRALSSDLYAHGSAILATAQQLAAAAGTALLVTTTTAVSADPAGSPDARGLAGAFVMAACGGIAVVATSSLVGAKGRR